MINHITTIYTTTAATTSNTSTSTSYEKNINQHESLHNFISLRTQTLGAGRVGSDTYGMVQINICR